MRDINPTQGDRSIRNIPLPKGHRRLPPPVVPEEDRPRPPRRARGGRWWIIALVVLVGAAALGLLISVMFAGATVTVAPRTQAVSINSTIVAQLNAPIGTLPYSTFSVTRSATTTTPATGQKQVSRQASGVATITNTYSSATQRLIANTRFEASDGKMYRIRDSVNVPGMSGDSPGTVTAILYADSPGESYNRTSQTTFTIPGFKGDPRYSKFSATAPSISGGFVGQEPAVADADLAKAKTALEKQLDTAVRAASLIPAGYMLVAPTVAVSFSGITQKSSGQSSASISESATATGAMIRTADLAAAVARKSVADYGGEAVAIADPTVLTINISTSTKATDSITLTVSGSPTLIWQFDPNAIKDALVGKPKAQFEDIIRSFEPAVAQADASIRPFWAGSFPADPNKIKVVVSGQ